MAKGRIEFNTFVKGLITEAGPLTYPEGASLDEANFVLNRDGSRQRRFGIQFEDGGTPRAATSIETDDVSLLFRYLDGFFFYGFILTFDEQDLFHWVDPKLRDTSKRDFDWFESMWKRNMISNKGDRYIGKLFSLSGTLPAFQKRFPDSKVLYMIRDPLSVIPSGLSLVTGVLDKKFNFWSLDEKLQTRFIERLYTALVQLLNRFHDDWTSGNINKEKVHIVRFDTMMTEFEPLMASILEFIQVEPTSELTKQIQITAEEQRRYESEHKYNLKKFGLTEERIRQDCEQIYKTFLN